MIARHDTPLDRNDLWAGLAEPLPATAISWRQDGRPVQRDGRWIARFVCYVDANTVRERLDTVVPGEWDLTLDLLPALPGEDGEQTCSFKARLQILGVIREDVGTGRDYKSAATDAFKRAAVRFGIAHELYAYEQNWVQVDGDGRYAKPLEDPAAAYARRYGTVTGRAADAERRSIPSDATEAAIPAGTFDAVAWPRASDEPSCPKCGGRMWDNRLTKRNPKAPDYKCRSRSCDGVVWPARGGGARDDTITAPEHSLVPALADAPAPLDPDELPF
jgi:hypothetical protein